MEKIKLCNGLANRDYVIPCFQREYSWGREEIEELIENIIDLKDNEEYCLGIITVKKENNKKIFLIDGQQRLTTLYMIAIWCNFITKDSEIKLSSEYNTIINKTSNLVQIINNPKINTLPYNLQNGWNIITTKIKEDEKNNIKRKIEKNLYYYEITLDNNTNLNHYFEVMNSRGIQLSRSDIVKSFLMNYLKDDYKLRLNYLWYIFEKMDNTSKKIENFSNIQVDNKSNYKSINEILEDNIQNNKIQILEDKTEYDTSILDFEYFLLYAIRLYKNRENLDQDISGEFNVKSLVEEYKSTFKGSQSSDIVEFLNFLISIKNIYDKYIVKYDKFNDTWKLEGINRQDMILIQSCLRVSFVNKRLMHWVYKTLAFFYKNKEKNETDKINEYIKEMEKFIKEKYVSNFIEDNKSIKYRTGFNTPIIILNYLDYLIEKNTSEVIREIPETNGIEFKEFKFKFRNSIEHFMPRHSGENWVDDFGNLALLAYGTNTKMQDARPDVKAKHFYKELSDYSLKLQIMSKIAINKGWNEENSNYMKEKCINILKRNLDMNK